MNQKVFTYKLRTFINASHAVRWQGVQGAEHPHTWELILDIRPVGGQFDLKFEDIEAVIADSVAPFHGQFLNEVPPFDQLVPTLENFAEQLFDLLSEALEKISCQLHDLSVGESPTRYYSVAINPEK
ncbi:6-carboxytetrahydropterin synthase [Leuconostoc holzapfelii]|uniref:6-carboxy-5,6,7,8-tetrahydropterin synthase n=1 Tax=Leuconostoc holzapfelii TaxID=434464 RepID=A0A846ZGF0_9LACO|nr:6-carboxytetrahydropterin synthase [Leuconostoc holzapfelii]NKZ18180.1 6-pyruvoyl tetrahydropterin synthase [Leuconostoc holzapfelii]